MREQPTPQTPFARTRPTYGTSPAEGGKTTAGKHILVAASGPAGRLESVSPQPGTSPVFTNRKSLYGRSPQPDSQSLKLLNCSGVSNFAPRSI
jgi:hypothetical protein